MKIIVLPLLIILLPSILFIGFGLWIKRKIKFKIILASILFFLLGLVVPWTATFMSARGQLEKLPEGYGCVTGASIFMILGYIINLIGIPLILIVFLSIKSDKKGNSK